MRTTFIILQPDQPVPEARETDMPEQPSFDQINAVVAPIVGEPIEHVAVLADSSAGEGHFERADMFVNELGHTYDPPLPRNEAATAIYRRNALLYQGVTDPESLPWIAGPAVLFERIVWT